MKTAWAIRHLHCEHLGELEAALRDSGYGIRYLEAPTADFEQPAPDLLVLLGGPISVNDGSKYPFLERELAFVQRALLERRLVLGVCLGAQLMAQALGAKVHAMAQKEVGWAPLSATPAGHQHPIAALLDGSLQVLHWHGETFELPAGATLLCSTAPCENQAFAVGRHALGLQFHPEVTAAQLESWFVAHTLELELAGLDIPSLRRASIDKAPLLKAPLRRLVNDWLAWAESSSLRPAGAASASAAAT
jgi:GMP synthase (glutamine-hydrolysing)